MSATVFRGRSRFGFFGDLAAVALAEAAAFAEVDVLAAVFAGFSAAFFLGCALADVPTGLVAFFAAFFFIFGLPAVALAEAGAAFFTDFVADFRAAGLAAFFAAFFAGFLRAIT